MQLPAIRWFVAEHGLEQLDVGRHNNRIVPILCGELGLVPQGCILYGERVEIAMMFQNRVLAKYMFQCGSCLHNDACVGYGDDDSLHPMA